MDVFGMLSSIGESYETAWKRRGALFEIGLVPLGPTLILSAIYVAFATVIGPRIMADRKPLQLRTAMLVYNLFQVVLCSYIVLKSATCGWMLVYHSICNEFDESVLTDMATPCLLYHYAKFIDFTDTFFFIVRKKFKHVSTLQLFHHGIMPSFVWVCGLWAPWIQVILFVSLNSFVHVVMYAYYFVAALGPRFAWPPRFKRYLTLLQMNQFVLVIASTLIKDCGAWPVFNIVCVLVMGTFLYLFMKYYREEFVMRGHNKSE